jgi:hypothetical protein
LAISNLTISDASVQIRNGHDAGFPDSVIIDSLSSSAFHSRHPLLCLFFRSDFFDSLDALVPDYLDAISIDLMDGAPLSYDAENLRIYSVGKDFIDSGGVAEKPGHLADSNETVIYLEGVAE